MNIVIQRFLYGIGKITGWRWLSLMAGVALITACSGKTDKNKVSTDTVNDTERVTCYEPVADTSRKTAVYPDSAVDNNSQPGKDSVEKEKMVPLHPCYVPVKPKE